jgi:Fur family transcriptional regulator, ferric uptake regulator
MVTDMSKKEMEPVLEGHKSTRQRSLILDIIRENTGTHLSADGIYTLIKQKDEHVGIATVYRNIKLMEEEGILLKAHLGENATAYYEICACGEAHTHHHLICTQCGKVDDVAQDLLDTIEGIISETKGFTIVNHRLNFYGICAECKHQGKDK